MMPDQNQPLTLEVATTTPAINVPAAKHNASTSLSFTAVAMVVAMVACLFLPWVNLAHKSMGIAAYSAPDFALAAWIMISLGIALAAIGVFDLLIRARVTWTTMMVGAILYLAGVVVWYSANVLPDRVARGCLSNAGDLCFTSTSAKLVPVEHAAYGLVIGALAALLLLGLSLAAQAVPRLWPGRSGAEN
jgi:hypothetical protein